MILELYFERLKTSATLVIPDWECILVTRLKTSFVPGRQTFAPLTDKVVKVFNSFPCKIPSLLESRMSISTWAARSDILQMRLETRHVTSCLIHLDQYSSSA